MDSALCVYKTVRAVGSRRVTHAWKQQNASVSHTLLELFVYLIANGKNSMDCEAKSGHHS